MPFNPDRMGAMLRGYRAQRRLTQKEVADAIDTSESTIVNYENGKGGMSYATACKLADLYGVTLDELGGRTAHQAV